MNLGDILERFREEARSNRHLGDRFERLIKTYLKTDPYYADLFEEVWLWSEWPDRWGPDTGIDLVARERETGEFWAIQCKFFDPAHTLQKADIDSFFTASGKLFSTREGSHAFAKRMIVSTTDKWSKHAEKSLRDQAIPVIRLRIQDLEESPIDWSQFDWDRPEQLTLRSRKTPRDHQSEAIEKVISGFKAHDRGKLIMACGTGKTFTALKIAETMVQKAKDGGTVLFLVPSIALLAQTLREWTAECEKPFHAFAVCSDTKVTRQHEDLAVHDLAFPATTDPARLARTHAAVCNGQRMTVVFSTYQSIDVIHQAQRQGFPRFDLVICDEAHRTTGVILEDREESHFVRIHDPDYIQADKRLYMTATPRIFGDAVKSKADEAGAVLCSMDDETMYGPVFYRLGFGEAVSRGLLADYKVLVLAVDEKHISRRLQRHLSAPGEGINLDDAVRIIGCWNGLSKRFIGEEAKEEDPKPMRRAVAFCRTIKDSKHIANLFQAVVDEYLEHRQEEDPLRCEVRHVDGSFNALERNRLLDWLKENAGEKVCRILSNARCLSEGVDVPALDAVLFLNPRKSVVDVVQSVGRVMRTASGKKYGYIILPIGVPVDTPPEKALDNNERYRVVWQVLQALRAHDDRFNVTINQLELNRKAPDNIQIIGVGDSGDDSQDHQDSSDSPLQFDIGFPDLEAWKDAIYARIVKKCGDRRYWEDWAKDVATIAERHITRIQTLIEGGGEPKRAFEAFLKGLRENINSAIGQDEAIEMLAQHLITRPVFDALFENYSFTRHNPVSQAMQKVLDVLEGHALERETEALRGFYESVRQRIKGIDNPEGRQKVIVELYDKFFKLAFPKMADRLGIVYTPVEVVDFILGSADFALRKHLGAALTDENVHILDPFTGTGTFIVRLLQSGLIRPEDLERKYSRELHANEIVLLAYYIAAINIEETYHGIAGGDYKPFPGIVLTDTFQTTEDRDLVDSVILPENSERVERQKKLPIRVIVGNPPYSAQQGSQNDNNQNLSYPALDARIRETYGAASKSANVKNLYDSYIRAIRWASDRIGESGVIGFVTNGSFIDANNMDGLRKCLVEEFSDLYVFNLRGNCRTQGEERRKEAGNVFGGGSRTPVAITLMVRQPGHQGPGRLHYHDIGDYLSREEKLAIIAKFGSIEKVPWQTITPNEEGDWIDQRDPVFETFMELGNKNDPQARAVFSIYSLGVGTNRDAWVYNFSKTAVEQNVRRMIEAYNEEVARYQSACKGLSRDNRPAVEDVIDTDPKRISWSSSLIPNVARGRKASFSKGRIVLSMYRPFSKQWLYFDDMMNHRVGKIPRLFPTPNHENVVISATGIGASKPFSALVTDSIPNLHLHDTGQCFPLYWYEKHSDSNGPAPSPHDDMFSATGSNADADGYIRHDAITDWALDAFITHYRDDSITKEDIFWYVYGILHSPEYRRRFAANLKRMLPRIPFAGDFWTFSKAGRELGSWHLNYETVEPWPLVEEDTKLNMDPWEHYRVRKMTFAKKGKEKDLTTIVYNSHLRLTGIPEEAYQYQVNGKSAIEWVMDRYQAKVDRASGIRNDPNDWCRETGNPRYIVDLIKRVVRVSMETVRIVKGLPGLGV